jgi:hypothetical protein
MEVIVIETEAYKQLQHHLENIERLFLDTVAELKELKNEKYWSVADVMEYTGFSSDWVLARKEHFGFFKEGKDYRFFKANVIKYMSLRSVEPKINRQLLKFKHK